jgi:hypothetical protein
VLLDHLDDYESYNPHVLEFVKKYAGLTSQQIRTDPKWQAAAANPPKHFDEMSDGEKNDFKKTLDARYQLNDCILAKAVAARE